MHGNSVYKAPNGKLLKIDLDFDPKEKLVEAVRVTGDFFIHPEDSIRMVENRLMGLPLDSKFIIHSVTGFLAENEIQVFGFTPADLAHAILMAAGLEK